jgi:acyl carrier protein
MDKDKIYEAVKEALVEDLGVNADDVTAKASFYNDLSLESLDMLKLFFSLEKKTPVRVTMKEIQGLMQGDMSEDEFFNENGLVTGAGLEHLQRIFPQINLAAIPGGLDQLKLFSLFTVGHLVDMIAQKAPV